MKKLFFGTITLFLMASCSDGGKTEREREDSIRKTDSIAQVEAEQAAEQARQDSLRQDSLRQDSIAKEEKMRITPQTIERGINASVLKALGFVKVSENRWLDGDLEGGEIKYTRTFNGRRVDYVEEYGGGNNYFQFFNSNDLKDFKEALKKSKFKPAGDGVYSSTNHWLKFEGNKMCFDFCW